MLTAIKAWLARQVAGPELERLQRFEAAVTNASRWLAGYPDAVDALDHVQRVAAGRDSYGAVSSVREVMHDRHVETMNKLRGMAMQQVRQQMAATDHLLEGWRLKSPPKPAAVLEERRR